MLLDRVMLSCVCIIYSNFCTIIAMKISQCVVTTAHYLDRLRVRYMLEM